ncbi:hypothetical protein ACHHRT_04185 [Desulfurivibrio sp. D14AmB]|uniref:hypothetical protein n=1 Tax=Desulfurivibrio sp. D14AmB TaxID=3374370 RepID=UPI00376EA9C2
MWRGMVTGLTGLVGGLLVALLVQVGGVSPAGATIRGVCGDCHTMHNSQDGGSMAFDGGSQVSPMLLRDSCVGCHAMNLGEKIVTSGGNAFPQVYHTDPSGDLAAGNFAYISGTKGGGADDRKGHNVIDLLDQDSRLYPPPGGMRFFFHDDGGNVNRGNLTCAGTNGCHGYRTGDGFANDLGSGVKALQGAHHGNVGGLLNTALTLPESYRFLLGVKGLENPNPDDRWQNASPSSHNEYFGAATPGAHYPDCGACHSPIDGHIRTPNGTISGFCATCHGNFHTLTAAASSGIGPDTISPFLRHPTDIVIRNSGEYADYNTYSITAPVGRQVLPATPSSEVTPGSDTVTCLSCHLAHASDYPGMLRFDYSRMMAHEGGDFSGVGCFACHTTKD